MHNAALGEIAITYGANGEVLVPKGALIDMLLPLLDADPDLLSRVQSIRDRDGFITLAAVESSGFVVELDRSQLRLSRATVVMSTPPAAQQPKRVSLLELTVTSGSRKLGGLTANVSGASTIRIPKAAFVDMISPVFDAATVAAIAKLPEVDGLVALRDLEASGLIVKAQGKHLDVTRGAVTASVGDPTYIPVTTSPQAAAPARPSEPPIGSAGRLALVVHGGEVLGEIQLRSNSENQILLTKSALMDILTPALEKEPSLLERLTGLPDRDGDIALEALQKAGVEARYTGGRVEFGARTGGEKTALAGFAKPMSPRLNPTGRTVTLNVPLVEGETRLGEIVVRIEPDGTISVPKAALVKQLASVVEQAALGSLQNVPDRNGFIALGDLSGAHFRLEYDPNKMEIAFSPRIEQRPRSDLRFAGNRSRGSSGLTQPALVSGFTNITLGADYGWETPGLAGFYLGLQSAIRVAGIVLENDATYEGEVDPVQCPIIARCLYEHQPGLKRRYSRLVYDLPDQRIRVQLGDVEQQTASFQRATDVAGVAIEKSARKLSPGENLFPTIASSFAIERSSDVDIVINGAIAQRLKLRPGNYSINDLPLAAGANDIELIITDDRGQRRTVVLNTFADAKLLAAGKSEWAMSAGLASFLFDGQRAYGEDRYLASAFYRLGLTDRLSVEAQGKSDFAAVEGGMGLLAATSWGVVGVSGAVSTSDLGIGAASNVSWDLVNLRGVLGTWIGARESLRLAAEARSSRFRSPGESLTISTGILYPETPYWLRLSGAYSIPIAANTTASVSARYQFADPNQPTYTPYRIVGDRYGTDVTLSSRLGSALSASVTAGYSNEVTQRAFDNPSASANPEARVMLRLFVLPMDNVRLSGSYDTLNSASSVSAYHGIANGAQRWEADLHAQTDGRAEQKLVNGSVLYAGNRGEMRLAQSASFDELQGDGPATARSSARFSTALAFADGRFGIGSPVRGNGFALVFPHESLAGKPITVGDAAAPRAYADGLGPGVVTDLPAYAPNSISVDVKDLPPGYSLGNGAFDVVAPYRAGYALQVGSAHSVSAFGTLLGRDERPLALTTGVARPLQSGNGEAVVTVFTNQAGRFVAEGLAPGTWVIEMAADGQPTTYTIKVPQGTQGLLQVGVLFPTTKM